MSATSITPTEFWRLHEFEPDTMLIDVSEPADFKDLHAEGVVYLPPGDLLQIAKQAKIRDKRLYLISRSGQIAAGLAAEFQQCGFDNVTAIAGGTEAWTASRLPVCYEHTPAEDFLCGAAGLIAVGDRQCYQDRGNVDATGVGDQWLHFGSARADRRAHQHG